MKVLLTGGAGYIGSVTSRALEAAGHEVVLLDSLAAGEESFVAGRTFYRGDIADRELIRTIAAEHPDLAGCIHLAALISVPESVANPLGYYRENVAKTLTLVEELTRAGLTRLVFSSSAAVYGPSESFEVFESDTPRPSSPYGRTKLMVEEILTDATASSSVRAISLRYFNPVGADPDLTCGIYADEPSHVLGQLIRTAQGKQEKFTLTGADLDTRDGTGIRDYIHVWDLALAHVSALENFDGALAASGQRHLVLNIGTGRGVSVRELIAMVEQVSSTSVPIEIAPARPGDVAGAYANVTRAEQYLGWRAQSSLPQAVASAWQWANKRTRAAQGR